MEFFYFAFAFIALGCALSLIVIGAHAERLDRDYQRALRRRLTEYRRAGR